MTRNPRPPQLRYDYTLGDGKAVYKTITPYNKYFRDYRSGHVHFFWWYGRNSKTIQLGS